MQIQLPLWSDETEFNYPSSLATSAFSHDLVNPRSEREALEDRYADLLEETDEFNRKSVSYQGNKGEFVHSWIKYKEGFSAQLVENLLQKFGVKPGQNVLEPFSGSATTLLIAKALGINATGIEILPLCHLAWEAKSRVFEYNLAELQEIYQSMVETTSVETGKAFPHLVITKSAFSFETGQAIMFYSQWFESLNVSHAAKVLCKLILTGILEEVSYTRKDGQYLRWDYRAEKVQERNEIRVMQGKTPMDRLDKGRLPSVKEALLKSFASIIQDIRKLQAFPFQPSQQQLIIGSSLEILPTLAADQFDCVITSPPYCNRYDYTRTYALELAFLGCGEESIRTLRQNQLACTVESRPKLEALAAYYATMGQQTRYSQITNVIQNNAALKEIKKALQVRWERGEINNKGILTMVEGYFTELTFIFAEVFRLCRSGAHIAFVNDNVRYGGEVIPVDLLTTNLAEQLGFEPIKIYVLTQRKGNSSQQMKKFGREALRKSVIVWRKP